MSYLNPFVSLIFDLTYLSIFFVGFATFDGQALVLERFIWMDPMDRVPGWSQAVTLNLPHIREVLQMPARLLECQL